MRHDVSALMDGELDQVTAKSVIALLKRDNELLTAWIDYHLIGDVMRQSAITSFRFSERFKEKLALEPTVVAPRRPIWLKTRVAALSAAASLAAVAVVAWMVLQNNADETKNIVAVKSQSNAAAALASLPRYPFNSTNHEYLIAHQEFSPSTAIQGVAPYIRTVSDDEESGR